MIIWGCKVYVVNSKAGNKSTDAITSKYSQKVVETTSAENIPHQADGYFMG